MKYIKYVIRNTEPFRITDDSTSHQGQASTLTYIPGSTMRGYVLSSLINRSKKDFYTYKKGLFSDDIMFLNAYNTVTINGKKEVLLPAPKGFYEDKTDNPKKELENVVVNDNLTAGFKRSNLGEYVYLQGTDINTFSIEKGADLKININSRAGKGGNDSIFRNEYVSPNKVFTGFIVVKDESLMDVLFESIGDSFKLGNSRSSGYGNFALEEKLKCDEMPYSKYAVTEDACEQVYMMLVSNTTMRNKYGQYCGIDIDELERRMGVKDLRIETCSTSTTSVRGLNRTWQANIPSVTMYEKGSVFNLSFSGTASLNSLCKIMESGLGIRLNEGFGQVLFIDKYDNYIHKHKGSEDERVDYLTVEGFAEDKSVLKQIAGRYVQNCIEDAMVNKIAEDTLKEIKGVSKSQFGLIESITRSYKYNPGKGIEELQKLFEHSKEKAKNMRVHKDKTTSIANAGPVLERIVEDDILITLGLEKKLKRNGKVMEIPFADIVSESDEKRIKLDLISRIIRQNNKEGRDGKN